MILFTVVNYNNEPYVPKYKKKNTYLLLHDIVDDKNFSINKYDEWAPLKSWILNLDTLRLGQEMFKFERPNIGVISSLSYNCQPVVGKLNRE